MDTREWLNNVTNGDSLRTIEKKTGVSYGTINSQRTTGVSAENVIAVARGYGIPPVSALVVTEFLTPAEVDKGDPKAAIRNATEEDLAEEVLRRMKLPGTHAAFTTPVDELIDESGNYPHVVASFDPDNDTPFFDPETMAAHVDDEYIAPDDQFDA